jgi:hypothetical protein
MSFVRRLMGALGAGMAARQGVEIGDRFIKTDGQYQSVWTVRQVVHFEGIPPHARLVPDQGAHLGYRTIAVSVLHDPDFYRRVTAPADGRSRGSAPY